MNKKIISAVLAGACAVSAMSTSAFAATAATNKQVTAISQVKLSATAAVASPVLNVSVPTAVAAVINPYGVSVTTKDGNVYDKGVSSVVYTIINQTESSGIQVTAIPTLTVNTVADAADKNITHNAITIATADQATAAKGWKGNEATKSAFVWLDVAENATTATYTEYVAADGSTPASGNATSKTDTKGNKTWTVQLAQLATSLEAEAAFKASTKPAETPGDILFVDVTSLKVVDTETTTTKDDGKTYYKTQANNEAPAAAVLAKLPAAPAATADANGGFTYTQFQFSGYVGGQATLWTTADKITLNVVLDIVPANVEA